MPGPKKRNADEASLTQKSSKHDSRSASRASRAPPAPRAPDTDDDEEDADAAPTKSSGSASRASRAPPPPARDTDDDEDSDHSDADREEIPSGSHKGGHDVLQIFVQQFCKEQRIRDLRLASQQKQLNGTLAALVDHLKDRNSPSSARSSPQPVSVLSLNF